MKLKLPENFEEITQNFVTLVETKGWSETMEGLLEQLYSRVPNRHGVWDNQAEPLAALVRSAMPLSRG